MSEPGTDLAVREPAELATTTLFGTDDPAQLVERASVHARALDDVVKERNLYQTIRGSHHIKVEGWTLLGSMLGVFPVLDGEVEPIEIDGIRGFRATVKAVTRNGEEVGRASAYCMKDEPVWGNRPLHALAGMAETRATSRALRKPLGFIVELAGYNPTPADEMPPPQVIDADVLEGTPLSDGWEDKPADFNPSTPVKVATEAQKKKLNVLVGKLRDDESPNARVTTERLWRAVAKRRGLDWSWLVEAKRGMYDGALHWSPLREDLTHEEASALIEQLSAVEKDVPPLEPGQAA